MTGMSSMISFIQSEQQAYKKFFPSIHGTSLKEQNLLLIIISNYHVKNRE